MEDTQEHQKERFSKAYVMAVGAAAGFVVDDNPLDRGSVDVCISAPNIDRVYAHPHLNIQAKCTSHPIEDPDGLRYDLPIINYNNLRRPNNHIPLILVVMVVPALQDDWLVHSEQSLTLLRCAYWRSLRGLEPTENESKIRMRLDHRQMFNVEALRDIMNQIADGVF